LDLRERVDHEAEDVARPWVASPPPRSLVVDGREDRPIASLRDVAGDPLRALRAAVAVWRRDRALGEAFAEIAVTGSAARERFDRSPITTEVLGGAHAAAVLSHAHRVAAYLDASASDRVGLARALADAKGVSLADTVDAPWLAVAAEVDPPRRPVNVGVTAHAQRDLVVDVDGASVRVRVAVAGDLDAPRGVIVLLHGLGSRLEEVDVVASALADRGFGVVALDLPSQGYSSRVAPALVGDPALGGYRAPAWDRDEGYTYLSFAERVVDRVIDALAIRERLVAIGGGSLGGTLALRAAIGRRFGKAVRSIAWSPGSVWGTQQTNYVNWAAIELTAGARLFRPETLADDHDDESADSRTDYIRWLFEPPIYGAKAQPTLWFKGMPREREHTDAARADRRELYDHAHRVTCLALAYEQTIYSITEIVRGELKPRFARIEAPVLVLAGRRDDDMLDIHREVGKLAHRMRGHGHRGRVVRMDACHSIHDERPRALAHEIDAFLREV
jgi:pimeloyl-ACP methyl ester carboxylesterase